MKMKKLDLEAKMNIAFGKKFKLIILIKLNLIEYLHLRLYLL